MVDDTQLVQAASAVRQLSYAPYSRFKMGAAIATQSDTVIPGALVENVSLGLAMCAERVALFSAVAVGERPLMLAVVSERTGGQLTFPCGACLQVALELAGPDLRVVAATPDGETASATLAELLPLGPRKNAHRT